MCLTAILSSVSPSNESFNLRLIEGIPNTPITQTPKTFFLEPCVNSILYWVDRPVG